MARPNRFIKLSLASTHLGDFANLGFSPVFQQEEENLENLKGKTLCTTFFTARVIPLIFDAVRGTENPIKNCAKVWMKFSQYFRMQFAFIYFAY